MSKNRTQYEEEAKELGIDFSGFQTNAEFQEAIAAKKKDANADNPPGPEESRPVNTDTDTKNPQDDQADIEAPMKPAGKAKEEKKAKGVVVETTRSVQFNINGEKQEGTLFTFENEQIAEARKAMLVERYGAGVIKE